MILSYPFPCQECGEMIEPGEWKDHMAEEHYVVIGESWS